MRCNACGKEMNSACGCDFTHIAFHGGYKERIRVGLAGDLGAGYISEGGRCGDCGAPYGSYHHDGCDMEACPICGEQMLSCNCDITELVYFKKE